MKNLNKIKNEMAAVEENWSWWGQRAHDALGIAKFIKFDCIISCDWGTEFKTLWKTENIISIEKKEGIRKNYSNNDINNFLNSNSKNKLRKYFKRDLSCLMYRSVKNLEKISAGSDNNIKIYSAPVHLKNTFDSKLFLRKILSRLKLPRLPGKIINISNFKFKEMVRELGDKFVIQYPVGSSGENTYFINSKKTYTKIQKKYQHRQSPVIATKFLDGYPVNINGVIGQNGIHISAPSIQVIGQSGLNPRRFGFSGNDFTAGLQIPPAVKESLLKITFRAGNFMRSYGFRGMMGMDFMVYNNKVYPVEINPRFQNSTSLLTLLELSRDAVPLVYYHICQFNSSLTPPGVYSGFKTTGPGGAQLIMHNLEGKKITVKEEIKPGIYKFDKNKKLQFLRPGYSVLDLKQKEEFCVCCGVLGENTVVEKGAPLLKLHYKKSVLMQNLKDIKPEIELTVKKIYNKLTGE